MATLTIQDKLRILYDHAPDDWKPNIADLAADVDALSRRLARAETVLTEVTDGTVRAGDPRIALDDVRDVRRELGTRRK